MGRASQLTALPGAGFADVWSRVAAAYDLQLPLERAALRGLSSMLALGRDSRVLDVATGTGALLRELATAPDPPASVRAIDSSAAMLARVGPLPPDWELQVADATRLPFGPESFDRAAAAYLLHLLDPADRRMVLAELRRVLAPGGLLGVLTVAPPNRAVERILRRPIERLADASDGAASGLRSLDPTAELERAGLQPLRAVRLRRGYPSLCVLAAKV